MLEREMNSDAVADWIMQDIADARAVGVDKTPGFFVNGRPLEPFGIDSLKALVAAEVRAVR
jgi:protein-disulfide isomerase